MAYVDLNPVRAAIASDLIESDFISIHARLFDYVIDNKTRKSKSHKNREKKQGAVKESLGLDAQVEAPLMNFNGSSHTGVHVALPFTLEDYFDLRWAKGKRISQDVYLVA